MRRSAAPARKLTPPRRGGNGEVAPVAERRRRGTDHEVADDPAGQTDRERQEDDAEQVEPGAHGREATVQAEHEGARQVEGEDQRGIESGDHRFQCRSRRREV